MTSASRLNDSLRWVFIVLFVLTALSMLYSFVNMPLYYQRTVSQTLPEPQPEGFMQASNARVTQEAANRGMSISQYGIYAIIRDILYSLGFYTVSFLILRRARGQWFLWFTAFVLFFIPGGQLHFYAPIDQDITRYLMLLGVFWPAYPLFLYLFPNGKAVPRWMLWLIGPVLALHLFGQFLAALAQALQWQIPLINVIVPYIAFLFVSFPLALVAQVYRYLRVSTREERQQTKWVLGGISIVVVSGILLNFLFNMTDAQADYGFASDASTMSTLFLPLTIGISILRYRLYDIDLIIRRTLQYSLLTLLLGLVYYGLVVLLGQLFQGVTGQNAPVVIVISTLVIAAIFNPLRTRIQSWIDRRFYRSRYNAAEALDRFSQNLRHQVDLSAIESELIVVVAETVQPETISLWTRKVEKR